jgi:hypothetical protein
VLDPKVATIETVEASSRPFEPEARVDGFSFASHSVGSGASRRLGLFKVVAWIVLGCTGLGLVAQAMGIVFSILHP